jgi:hypothetical protein
LLSPLLSGSDLDLIQSAAVVLNPVVIAATLQGMARSYGEHP